MIIYWSRRITKMGISKFVNTDLIHFTLEWNQGEYNEWMGMNERIN